MSYTLRFVSCKSKKQVAKRKELEFFVLWLFSCLKLQVYGARNKELWVTGG